MPTEIERKYLVKGDGWRASATDHVPMRQGYFQTGPGSTVRVRIEGERAVLTIKGPTVGISRAEYEYEIPLGDARQMLDIFCEGRQVEKVRHYVSHAQKTWEVDVFEGANQGLVLAEVELERADEEVDVPKWIGEEVSHDSRYRNACLARQPMGDETMGD